MQHRLIEAAASIVENDESELCFQHTFFCQTGLPYRRVARTLKYHGDPTDLIFTPLVLVNTGVASGVTIDGVPVLDTFLLEEYLASGTLSFIFEIPGPADSPLETVTLYHDQHEAEANLQVYVSSPPTERLRQLRTKKIRVHTREWGFGTIIYECFEVSECRTVTEMQTALDLVRREWKQNCTGRLARSIRR